MTTATIQLRLPRLHPGQRTVWDDPARFKLLACGRRWGKSRLGSLLCLAVAAEGGRAWWVGPSYPVASVGWRMIRRLAAQIPGVQVREVERMVELPSGGTVQVKSADNPDSLRGEGLNFVVIDECAFVKEDAWTEALRPALADRKGGAMFISTPKGHNWFWRLFMGADGQEWKAWRFSSYDNPFLDPTEIDAARDSLSERTFKQEFLAEFLSDGAGVVRFVRDAIYSPIPTWPERGSTYVGGLDWALSNDFTVLTIVDATKRRVVLQDAFNGIDYRMQRERIAAACKTWNVAVLVAEQNAMGKPNNDELRRAGVALRDFTTTNTTKADIIEGLAAAFENHVIGIPDEGALIAELEALESQRLPSGAVRYAAPDGMHDDRAISLALAWHAASAPPKRVRSREY